MENKDLFETVTRLARTTRRNMRANMKNRPNFEGKGCEMKKDHPMMHQEKCHRHEDMRQKGCHHHEGMPQRAMMERRREFMMAKRNRRAHSFNTVLAAANTKPGITPSELCEILDLRPSTMSELLKKMEGLNLIKREKDENDSRVTHIFALEKDDDANKINPFEGILTEEEEKEFIRLANKLMDGVKVIKNED